MSGTRGGHGITGRRVNETRKRFAAHATRISHRGERHRQLGGVPNVVRAEARRPLPLKAVAMSRQRMRLAGFLFIVAVSVILLGVAARADELKIHKVATPEVKLPKG
jgi:hypothetical protein